MLRDQIQQILRIVGVNLTTLGYNTVSPSLNFSNRPKTMRFSLNFSHISKKGIISVQKLNFEYILIVGAKLIKQEIVTHLIK